MTPNRSQNRLLTMKMNLIRTNSLNTDFRELCLQLDRELEARYGNVQSEYDRYNVIEDNRTVIVGYIDGIPAGIGCFKVFSEDSVEIKRMFVKAEHRRKGLSTGILSALENWAREQGFNSAILETGKGQPEAINLYKKQGYKIIENYGQYIGNMNSLCMKKEL